MTEYLYLTWRLIVITEAHHYHMNLTSQISNKITTSDNTANNTHIVMPADLMVWSSAQIMITGNLWVVPSWKERPLKIRTKNKIHQYNQTRVFRHAKAKLGIYFGLSLFWPLFSPKSWPFLKAFETTSLWVKLGSHISRRCTPSLAL